MNDGVLRRCSRNTGAPRPGYVDDFCSDTSSLDDRDEVNDPSIRYAGETKSSDDDVSDRGDDTYVQAEYEVDSAENEDHQDDLKLEGEADKTEAEEEGIGDGGGEDDDVPDAIEVSSNGPKTRPKAVADDGNIDVYKNRLAKCEYYSSRYSFSKLST